MKRYVNLIAACIIIAVTSVGLFYIINAYGSGFSKLSLLWFNTIAIAYVVGGLFTIDAFWSEDIGYLMDAFLYPKETIEPYTHKIINDNLYGSHIVPFDVKTTLYFVDAYTGDYDIYREKE